MKVLVVDDSVVFRTAIKSSLMQSSDIKDVVTANNGKIAVDLLKQEHFDAITLDLEMPVMDGVEAIKEIRKFNKKIPIIIFSAQNQISANKTLTALEYGADDFVQKIDGNQDVSANLKMIQAELIPKFKALLRKTNIKSLAQDSSQVSKKTRIDYKKITKPSLICIGSSTGGPDTLKSIFKSLKDGIQTPILIVQHMPPVFTTQLAKGLNALTDMTVVEAQHGDLVQKGYCYVAPGDYHMGIIQKSNQYFIELNQDEKVCYVRPAVDVMLDSVAMNFNEHVASFILTGMGSDGANGCQTIKATEKGPIFIQDEESCTVYGMPKAVYDLDLYDGIADIEGIAQIINTLT